MQIRRICTDASEGSPLCDLATQSTWPGVCFTHTGSILQNLCEQQHDGSAKKGTCLGDENRFEHSFQRFAVIVGDEVISEDCMLLS